MRAARVGCVLVAILALGGCDKLGLGKKDGDGGTTTTTGGGIGGLSFLSGTFEGEITMNVTGHNTGKGGGPHQMIMGIKSPKLRIDTVGNVGTDNPLLAQGAGFIIDPPAKKAIMLMPAQKKAMVIDFEKMKALRPPPGAHTGGGAPSVPSPSDPPKIEKTGKKEVIAGYECEDWKITSKTSHADMCVAEGIKWIDLTDLGLASPEATLAVAASDLNHFPLKVVSYDEKNVETTRMEATKIDKKTLDASRFVVPPDFQIIDMSAMLGGLQGIGSGGRPPGLPPGFVPPQKR